MRLSDALRDTEGKELFERVRSALTRRGRTLGNVSRASCNMEEHREDSAISAEGVGCESSVGMDVLRAMRSCDAVARK